MIVLVGFMGAGKSSALKAFSRGGSRTVDADQQIELREGRSIPEIFASGGEEAFRGIEAEVVAEALADPDLDVLALGGGAVSIPAVREALAAHTVVLLDISADDAWARVRGTNRPLARDEGEFRRLHAERAPLYDQVADVVFPAGRRALMEPAARWIRRMEELPEGTRLLWAASATAEYPVMVGAGLLGLGLAGDEALGLPGGAYLFTDTSVGELYAAELDELAGEVRIPPGEAVKNLATAERAMRDLARQGMTRSDHVLALGGGVVGDIAGFCAHTYQRGVPVVQLPTTLVAQVDSAYGGKTGVDIPEGKNYVGAFHLPRAVIADTQALATLPEAELTAGMAEVVKTALLAGGALWEEVLALEPGEIAARPDLVFGCARYKCEIVAADERDTGVRAYLNLGHTVGHAIEAATGYERYRHGEAVALGLLAALRLSGAGELRETVRRLLERHGLPTRLDPAIDTGAVVDAVSFDKKKTARGVGFVLISEPGRPEHDQLVDPAEVRRAVEDLKVA